MNELPPTEKWFVWKQLATCGDEEKPRLITPWGDPMEYEYAADGLFETEEQALQWKREVAPDEDWYLVEQVLRPLSRVVSIQTEDEQDE